MFSLISMLLCTGAAAASDVSVRFPIDAAQYQADVELLAHEPRPPQSAGWSVAQTLCEMRLRDLGYDVELHDYGTGVNVVGVRVGTKAPDEHVVVSAHYDSVENSLGADDNATGVAAVLSIADALASAPTQDRTLVVACWDQEEAGMIGSQVFASRAHNHGANIHQAYVFEMIGYRDNRPNTQQLPMGFGWLFPGAAAELRALDNRGTSVVFVGDKRRTLRRLQAHAAHAGLPGIGLHVPRLLREAALYRALQRSDHASFWAAGYPAVMITDTADYRNPNYHQEDPPATLDYDYALRVVRTTLAVVAEDLKSDS